MFQWFSAQVRNHARNSDDAARIAATQRDVHEFLAELVSMHEESEVATAPTQNLWVLWPQEPHPHLGPSPDPRKLDTRQRLAAPHHTLAVAVTGKDKAVVWLSEDSGPAGATVTPSSIPTHLPRVFRFYRESNATVEVGLPSRWSGHHEIWLPFGSLRTAGRRGDIYPFMHTYPLATSFPFLR